MKTKEQIERALKGYQKMLEDNQRIMDFEDDFMKAHALMEDRKSYIESAIKYHEAEKIVYACQKLIKNCKWILDIE